MERVGPLPAVPRLPARGRGAAVRSLICTRRKVDLLRSLQRSIKLCQAVELPIWRVPYTFMKKQKEKPTVLVVDDEPLIRLYACVKRAVKRQVDTTGYLGSRNKRLLEAFRAYEDTAHWPLADPHQFSGCPEIAAIPNAAHADACLASGEGSRWRLSERLTAILIITTVPAPKSFVLEFTVAGGSFLH